MTTIATNNAAVSPTIYSSGLFSQTAHTAQFNRKLQPFYAKQTQFPKKSNPPNHQHSKDLRQNGHLVTREKQTQFQFQAGGSICPLLRRWYCLLPRLEFCAWCFEFVSDLDIRISCFNPTIMQNKPNFRKHKMDLSHYEQKDYEYESPFAFGQNKPNQTQYCSALEIRPRRIHAGPPANLRHRRNKINQNRTHFFKTPQNSPKTARFPHFFSFFLTFSHVFSRFQHFSPPISAFVRVN